MSDEDVLAYLAGDTDIAPAGHDPVRLEHTRELLGQPALWIEPSPDLEQRVVAAVLAASAAPTSDATAGAVAGTVDGAPDGTQPARQVADQPGAGVVPLDRRRTRWVRYTVLAVAAAVLLAVGVATVTSSHHHRSVEFAAPLAGTSLAPGAKGSATLTQTSSGWRIHLSATGLPRLANGSYYEGWLKNAAGALVPIGTFNEGTDVTLWAGVPPSAFPTITVTRQQAGGGPASSGQKVLGGVSHRIH